MHSSYHSLYFRRRNVVGCFLHSFPQPHQHQALCRCVCWCHVHHCLHKFTWQEEEHMWVNMWVNMCVNMWVNIAGCWLLTICTSNVFLFVHPWRVVRMHWTRRKNKREWVNHISKHTPLQTIANDCKPLQTIANLKQTTHFHTTHFPHHHHHTPHTTTTTTYLNPTCWPTAWPRDVHQAATLAAWIAESTAVCHKTFYWSVCRSLLISIVFSFLECVR